MKRKKTLNVPSWENINKSNYFHFSILYYLQASDTMHLSVGGCTEERDGGVNEERKGEAKQSEERR